MSRDKLGSKVVSPVAAAMFEAEDKWGHVDVEECLAATVL